MRAWAGSTAEGMAQAASPEDAEARAWRARSEGEDMESDSDGKTLSQPSVESTDGDESDGKTLTGPSDDEQ
jgi:hypothetical protein